MTAGSALAYRFYGYQLRWLNDRSRFKIGKWSRQVGKTFTTTFEIAEELVSALVNGHAAPWVMLSRGERQSAENLRQLKMHLKAMGKAFEELESEFRVDENISYKQLEIRLSEDVWVIALPANPDTARGYSANIYLDEFAIHRDSREIWAALFPVISAGWRIIITSTPKGKSNKFYELMTAEGEDWSRHIVDIHAAVADGLPRDIEALKSALADDDAWAQEFELHWLDEASAWLSYDLITAVEDDAAGDPTLYRGGPCYLGNDIAARRDLWVTWVLEEVGDVLWQRMLVIRRRASFAEQDRVMDELFETFLVARLCMDQTGMGEKPVEDAKRRYGSARVEGVLFTPAAKLILATTGKQAFEDRKVRIQSGDTPLRTDLHTIKKVVGPTGVPRFLADSDSGGHADRAWALFLALHGSIDLQALPAGASIDPSPEINRPQRAEQGRVIDRPVARVRGQAGQRDRRLLGL